MAKNIGFLLTALFFFCAAAGFSQETPEQSGQNTAAAPPDATKGADSDNAGTAANSADDPFPALFADSRTDTFDEFLPASEAGLLDDLFAPSAENLDDLFNVPSGDMVAVPQPQVDYKTRVEQNNDKILFRGDFNASGGIAAGWSRLPDSAKTFKQDFGISPVALANVHLYMDARPIPAVKIFADIYTEIDRNAIGKGWAGVKIDSLYGEYDFMGFTYFRVGQFTTKWGNGRIFTPGNLMLNSQRGTSLGLTFPTLLDGIKYVTIADYEGLPGSVKEAKKKKDVTASELVHALILDKAIARTRLTFGLRYQVYDGIKALFSASTILFGTDLFADLVVLNPDFTSYNNIKFKVLAGFYREWKNIKLYFEYFYDGASNYADDHNLGLGLKFDRIFNSPFNFNLLVEHTFADNSGNIIPMFTISPWKHITINFGLPFIWGASGTRYLQEKNSSQYSRVDITNDIPRNKQLSFLIAVKFSAPF